MRSLSLLACGFLLALTASCGGSNPTPDAPPGDDVSVAHADLDAPDAAEAYVPTLEGPLRILSASPAGPLQSLPENQVLAVTFSRPMVPLGTADPPSSGALSVDPAVPGSLRWEGTQTLFFEPEDGFAPATEYTVRLDSAVADLDGNTLSDTYTWSFQTPRPRLVSASPADGARFVAPEAVVRLSFSLPVDASEAADYVEASFPIDGVENDGDSTLVVTPDFFTSFENGADHTVILKQGLPARGHELGMAEEREIAFRVRPSPEITDLDQPGRHGDDFYPDRGVQLEFSTPVRFGDLRKALSFEPGVELLPGAEARDDNVSTSHTIPATFEPETQYTLTINGLSDRFGASMEESRRTFRTRGFEPKLQTPSGRPSGPTSFPDC